MCAVLAAHERAHSTITERLTSSWCAHDVATGSASTTICPSPTPGAQSSSINKGSAGSGDGASGSAGGAGGFGLFFDPFGRPRPRLRGSPSGPIRGGGGGGTSPGGGFGLFFDPLGRPRGRFNGGAEAPSAPSITRGRATFKLV